MTSEFHLARAARRRYGVGEALFGLKGDDARSNLAASRRLAARMNADPARANDPDRAIHAGQLTAMGLIDSILRRMTNLYRRDVNPSAMRDALAAVGDRVGQAGIEATLERFADEFPMAAAYRNGVSGRAWLDGRTDGIPNREVAIEELLLLWLANANPAFAPFEELFDDAPLAGTGYGEVIAGLIAFFATQPAFGPDGQTLVEMLRSPAVAIPDSLGGQLRFVRERWTSMLGELLADVVLNLDVLAEEEIGIWRRFHPTDGGGGVGGAAGVRIGRGAGAARDEGAPRPVGQAWLSESGWYGTGEGGSEEERFSLDVDWMPRLVLLAKSTYVWLDQLSREFGRDIYRLDHVPDEELDRIARLGFTGIWLIGLWQRSNASQRIKVLRGNPEAVASAYSLDDYRIADDLGGEAAYENLKARAWARGIRIGTDMVPNHMGIDSRWVMEHPEWFISVPEPPYPAYSYTGPDLSTDPRTAIYLEDHYFDNTDAAVVFKRVDRSSGEERFVYHGNDGTSTPWNDTAQLNYLRSDVREAVIQTIIAVARRSPVIRFDAAMTLAKRHIERLWYPEPGHGGGIPSRAEHAMPKAEFERLMPVEFWREVVDRVAAEVPDTLLLAEAFWLMEGYFVRTLGMHRVYNSAFMIMLRDEDNANYRSVMKNTIEFDPEVLKRYVNFMSNPDERTAVDQFGKGDKYFGVATLMATLPGLPMVGHGQIEGYTEKYGMEYRRAYFDERPDRWLVERHEREIVPLFRQRDLFANVDDFLLYDLVRDGGTVDEDVFAYSNRGGGESSLVIYNNRFGSATGRIRVSAPYAARTDDVGRAITQRTLGQGLGLRDGHGWLVVLRDVRSGREWLQPSRDIHDGGLHVDLAGYECRVYLGIREVQDSEELPWSLLAADLGGRAVPSLDEAMREMRLRPVQRVFVRLMEPARLDRLWVATSSGADSAAIRSDLDELAAAVRAQLGTATPDATTRDRAHEGLAATLTRLVALARQEAAEPSTEAPEPEPVPARPTEPAGARPVPVDLRDDAPTGLTGTGTVDAGAADRPIDTPAWVPDTMLGSDRATRTAEVARPLLVALDALVGRRTDDQALAGEPGLDGVRVREWLDRFGLGSPLAGAFRAAGQPEDEAWRSVDGVRALLVSPPFVRDDGLPTPPGTIVSAWLGDQAAERFLRVNDARGIRWFNRESFGRLVEWTAIAGLVRASETADVGSVPSASAPATAIVEGRDADALLGGVRSIRRELLAAAERSGYRVDALLAAADTAPNATSVATATAANAKPARTKA